MHFTRLNESDEYRRQREELRIAELGLIDHVERVAALRRDLSSDTVVDDYELIDVSTDQSVRLSELFRDPDRALVLYHFMYGKAQGEPCPLSPVSHLLDLTPGGRGDWYPSLNY